MGELAAVAGPTFTPVRPRCSPSKAMTRTIIRTVPGSTEAADVPRPTSTVVDARLGAVPGGGGHTSCPAGGAFTARAADKDPSGWLRAALAVHASGGVAGRTALTRFVEHARLARGADSKLPHTVQWWMDVVVPHCQDPV